MESFLFSQFKNTLMTHRQDFTQIVLLQKRNAGEFIWFVSANHDKLRHNNNNKYNLLMFWMVQPGSSLSIVTPEQSFSASHCWETEIRLLAAWRFEEGKQRHAGDWERWELNTSNVTHTASINLSSTISAALPYKPVALNHHAQTEAKADDKCVQKEGLQKDILRTKFRVEKERTQQVWRNLQESNFLWQKYRHSPVSCGQRSTWGLLNRVLHAEPPLPAGQLQHHPLSDLLHPLPECYPLELWWNKVTTKRLCTAKSKDSVRFQMWVQLSSYKFQGKCMYWI